MIYDDRQYIVSTEKLAELLGIEPVQIQRYEDSGYAGASRGMLLKAAEILKVRTAGLFETETLPKDGMRASKG